MDKDTARKFFELFGHAMQAATELGAMHERMTRPAVVADVGGGVPKEKYEALLKDMGTCCEVIEEGVNLLRSGKVAEAIQLMTDGPKGWKPATDSHDLSATVKREDKEKCVAHTVGVIGKTDDGSEALGCTSCKEPLPEDIKELRAKVVKAFGEDAVKGMDAGIATLVMSVVESAKKKPAPEAGN